MSTRRLPIRIDSDVLGQCAPSFRTVAFILRVGGLAMGATYVADLKSQLHILHAIDPPGMWANPPFTLDDYLRGHAPHLAATIALLLFAIVLVAAPSRMLAFLVRERSD